MHRPPPTCPLCTSDDCLVMCRGRRDYFRCEQCQLVFVPPDQWPSLLEERQHYDLHQNSPDDQRYRRFLDRLCAPLAARLLPSSRGLDFGSGPGPTLSVMFEEQGHHMRIFDPYYAPDASVFDEVYDFITATEVVEHLHHPARELERLWNALKPGGWLGVMTKRVTGDAAFEHWHYKDDPTHVCFFSEPTFRWLADQWNAELTITGPDTVLFQKNSQ